MSQNPSANDDLSIYLMLGVGKTATAEAVAQESEKPLFAITCGDLGIEPTNVEQNLTRIFRWATIWGCILLLDEADVFFTRRSPSDLQRNALVTGKLRNPLSPGFLMLLYYGQDVGASVAV